jgi:hypothetical protein
MQSVSKMWIFELLNRVFVTPLPATCHSETATFIAKIFVLGCNVL